MIGKKLAALSANIIMTDVIGFGYAAFVAVGGLVGFMKAGKYYINYYNKLESSKLCLVPYLPTISC